MYKELRKLWFRNIKSNLIQFFTIISIMILSISFLLGLLSTSNIIKENMDNYFEKSRLYDLNIMSFSGFEEKDIQNIENITKVSKIEKNREEDLWIEKEDGKRLESKVIYIDKFDKEKFYLKEGRLPKNKNEAIIVVGNNIVDKTEIDKEIKIHMNKEDEVKTYKIVGKIISPQLISLRGEFTSIGGGNLNNILYVFKDGSRGYESLNIFLQKDSKINYFSKIYEENLNELDKIIHKIDEERIKSNNSIDIIKNPYKHLPWKISKSIELNGISSFKGDIEKIGAIAKIFPFFFFIVGFLVVTTSMTKIVDDHRNEIGTLVSLGYSKKSIYIFYLVYGIFISLISNLIGIPLGFEIFPKVIGKAYSTGYNLPEIDTIYISKIFLPVGIIASLVLLLTILYVLHSVLNEQPAQLFLDKETKNAKRKKIIIERIYFLWCRLSFKTKVNIRNIFLYKKRMLMTIVGISGCFALVLTSFGLKDSISSIVDNQYSKIYSYDLRLSFKNEGSFFDKEKANDIKGDTIKIASLDASVNTDKKNTIEKANISIIDDKDDISGFINLYDRNDNIMPFNNRGVYISQKLSEICKLNIGDNVKLEVRDKTYYFRISGIFKNHIGHQIIVKESYFKKITKLKASYKTLYLKFNKKMSDSEIENLTEILMRDDNVLYVLSTKFVKNTFKDSVSNLNYVIIVMNISAGLLTFVILYNLSNINIIERRKELATLKVLGFMPLEIRSYIYRETNGLSLFAMLIGFPLGYLLHRFVIIKTEVGGMMLGREISLMSYILSVMILISFILITNLFLRKKLNDINMVEAMKAND